jgi:hypothetical protein
MLSLSLRSFADSTRKQELFEKAESVRVIRRGQPQIVELK